MSHVGSDLGKIFGRRGYLDGICGGLMEEAMEYFLKIRLGKIHHRRQSISIVEASFSLSHGSFTVQEINAGVSCGSDNGVFRKFSKVCGAFPTGVGFGPFQLWREILRLQLDRYSGAGFSSKNQYMFGKVSLQIKLIEDDSAGIVTAFYMSSDGPNRNEFDFEFLGNSTGEPYSVQTNLYVNGVGNREQRLNLWFDPTKDFHSYSIFWDQRHIVFLVDDPPIRVIPIWNSEEYRFQRINPCECTARYGMQTNRQRKVGE